MQTTTQEKLEAALEIKPEQDGTVRQTREPLRDAHVHTSAHHSDVKQETSKGGAKKKGWKDIGKE